MRCNYKYESDVNWTWPGFSNWPICDVMKIKEKILIQCRDARIYDWMFKDNGLICTHTFKQLGMHMFEDIMSEKVRITYCNHLSSHLFFNIKGLSSEANCFLFLNMLESEKRREALFFFIFYLWKREVKATSFYILHTAWDTIGCRIRKYFASIVQYFDVHSKTFVLSDQISEDQYLDLLLHRSIFAFFAYSTSRAWEEGYYKAWDLYLNTNIMIVWYYGSDYVELYNTGRVVSKLVNLELMNDRHRFAEFRSTFYLQDIECNNKKCNICKNIPLEGIFENAELLLQAAFQPRSIDIPEF